MDHNLTQAQAEWIRGLGWENAFQDVAPLILAAEEGLIVVLRPIK